MWMNTLATGSPSTIPTSNFVAAEREGESPLSFPYFIIQGEKTMIIDDLITGAASHVRHRLWILSDLQQQQPKRAAYCMKRAADDFISLGLPVEAVCYLGDATEGHNLEFIHEMAQMQAEQFARVHAPKYYAVGNHDFDYFAFYQGEMKKMCIPFVEFMRSQPDWHMPEDVSSLYQLVDMGDYALCFFPDHADPAGSWYTTHGEIRGDASAYPYTTDDYRHVMEEISALNKPVLTLSHYSFAGGNRAAPLLNRFLPVAGNVRMHFYGHAHIGDEVWAGKDCHRKIAAVDGQPLIQIDVASLENDRGTAVRSVIVEWYDTQEIGVLFRNHSEHCWDDYLVVREGDGLRAPQDAKNAQYD